MYIEVNNIAKRVEYKISGRQCFRLNVSNLGLSETHIFGNVFASYIFISLRKYFRLTMQFVVEEDAHPKYKCYIKCGYVRFSLLAIPSVIAFEIQA